MRTTISLLLLMAPALGGCATYSNLAGEQRCKVYGGTRLDAAIIAEDVSPDSQIGKARDIEPPVRLYSACAGLADLPLSLVADTALLPVTVPLAVSHPAADRQEEAPVEKEAAGD